MEKRLYRSKSDTKIAGVCGGLAEYLNVDPTIIRIGFLLILFLNGVGIILYIIMWIVLPVGQGQKCGECDSPISESAKYCSNCGAAVIRTEAKAEETKVEKTELETDKHLGKEKKEGVGMEVLLLLIGFLFVAWGIGKFFTHGFWFDGWHWFDRWDWWYVSGYGFPVILAILGIILLAYGLKR